MSQNNHAPTLDNAALDPATDVVFREVKRVSDFAFDSRVTRVFDDMVSRSVPFYSEVQRMQSDLAPEFIPEHEGAVVDLGCSTATTILLMANNPRCPASCRFIGVDNSEPMLARAREKAADLVRAGRADFRYADLNSDFEPPAANVAVMNWTLQFVRPLHREALVRRVHDALAPAGAFLLSEKILVGDSALNRAYIDRYYAYKAAQGYTGEEIQKKREALENVLVPYRVDENVELLKRCGFRTVDVFFRWHNFASFVAVKHG